MRALRLSAFPLACILLCATVCRGWGAFDRRFLPGTILLMGACALIMQQIAVRRWKVTVRPWAAVSLLVFALIYTAGALLAPELFYSMGALELLIAAGCFLVLCLFWPERTDGLQLLGGVIFWAGMVYFLSASMQWLQRADSTFAPDGLFCYLLSKSFPDQFGLVGTVRQYVIPSDYGMSFPYFYPLASFLLRLVTGLEIYAGVLVNLMAAILTAFVMVDISLRYSGRAWPGQVVSALLLSCVQYQLEVNSAQSIPLALLLSLLTWSALARLYAGLGRMAAPVAGLMAGALAVTRFDGMALLAFGALVALLCRGRRLRALCGYGAAALIPMTPWAVYSMHRFGTLWATDNAGTAFRVETVIPTAVFVPGEDVLTLFNAPGAWFDALWHKAGRVLYGLLTCSFPLDVLLIGALAGLAAMAFKKRQILSAAQKKQLWMVGALVFFYTAKTGVYVLVGYGDYRYHIETLCVVAVGVLTAFASLAGPMGHAVRWGAGCLAVCAVLLLARETSARDVAFRAIFRSNMMPLTQAACAPQRITELERELINRQVDPSGGLLALTVGPLDYELGGYCPNWKVYVQPANPTWERIEYMLEEYMDVKAILLQPGWVEDEEIQKELDRRYPAQNFTADGREYVLYELA